jgi:hypothetical protein
MTENQENPESEVQTIPLKEVLRLADKSLDINAETYERLETL